MSLFTHAMKYRRENFAPEHSCKLLLFRHAMNYRRENLAPEHSCKLLFFSGLCSRARTFWGCFFFVVLLLLTDRLFVVVVVVFQTCANEWNDRFYLPLAAGWEICRRKLSFSWAKISQTPAWIRRLCSPSNSDNAPHQTQEHPPHLQCSNPVRSRNPEVTCMPNTSGHAARPVPHSSANNTVFNETQIHGNTPIIR